MCRAYLVFAEVIGLREGDRYLIVLPFFHSFGLHAGILCCLMKGATIYPLLVFDPPSVMRRIAEEGITAFPGAPAMYQAILNDPTVESFDLSSLRLAILGAAAISVDLVEGMRNRLGHRVCGDGLRHHGRKRHRDDVPLRRSSRGDRGDLGSRAAGGGDPCRRR